MTDWITIGSGQLTAQINPLGAELSSLKDADGRELMTDADPAFWTGRAPLLFPVVGATVGNVIRVDGREYPMEKHGFARRSRFEVIAAEPTRAVFALTDSEATREHYPFAFRLEVAFALAGATLATEATIANPGDVPLPASFGFHPAFAWPLPYGAAREDHRITFASDEPGALKRLAPDGTIGGTRPSPLDGRALYLADALFEQDALIWNPVASEVVTYGPPAGPQLRIAFPDTPSLGIWTKPGVFVVPPGGSKRIGITIALLP